MKTSAFTGVCRLLLVSAFAFCPIQTRSAEDDASPDLSAGSKSFHFWQCDSTAARRLPYRSFADVLDIFPGIWIADRGSVGQPLFASLFGSPLGRMMLRYNGLDLSDPVTGRTDLNLVPTESVAETRVILDTGNRNTGYMAPGLSIDLRSRSLAAVPVRTRVAYRTGGMGYDDIDLRLGVLIAPQTQIDAGILMKNGDGTDLLHPYEAQKIDLRVEHRFGQKYAFRYALLRNTSDVDLLLPAAPPEAPKLEIMQPHRKEVRTDHGFSLNLPVNLHQHLQITDLYREYYPLQDRGAMEVVDARRTIWSGQWQRQAGSWAPVLGGELHWIRLQSSSWGDRDERFGRFWSGLDWSGVPDLKIYAGALSCRTATAWQLFPELTAELNIGRPWRLQSWIRGEAFAPTLEQHLRRSSFALGRSDLPDESQTHAGLAIQRTGKRIELAFSTAWIRRTNPVLLTWEAEQSVPRFNTFPGQEQLCIDLGARWNFIHDFTLSARGQLFESIDDVQTGSYGRPDYLMRLILEFHQIWFSGDLDFRCMAGLDAWGEQQGMLPLDIQVGGWVHPMPGAALPWLQITAEIGDASLFALLANPLNLDVQSLVGFPQPGRFFRWGFAWDFYD
ncbi:Plug domain-containing protein [candidate division KSB1 bacterium]|nr:Plug domain-containing protein [candidate division KSB1 bacterium]